MRLPAQERGKGVKTYFSRPAPALVAIFMKKPPIRQYYIDSLRGLAALIVVFHHYLLVFYPYTVGGQQGGYEQHFTWENIFFYPPFGLLNAGRLAVSLFFILSGYVLSYKYLGEAGQSFKILASIIKRPIRLGGLVWFSIICGACLWYWGLFANNSVAEVTSSQWFGTCWANKFDFNRLFFILRNAAFSRGRVFNPPLWTIKVELYGSIMVFLYILLLGQFRYRILVSALLIFLFRGNLYQGFWIGLCIADLKKNFISPKSIRLGTILNILIFVIFMYGSSYPAFVNKDFIQGTIYSYLPVSNFPNNVYPMFFALLIFLLVLSNKWAKDFLNNPFFLCLGEISYGIYAMHFIVLGSLSSWLFLVIHRFLGYNFSFWIVFLSALPTIVGLAYIVTKYVDIPSIKLANYVGRKVVYLHRYYPKHRGDPS